MKITITNFRKFAHCRSQTHTDYFYGAFFSFWELDSAWSPSTFQYMEESSLEYLLLCSKEESLIWVWNDMRVIWWHNAIFLKPISLTIYSSDSKSCFLEDEMKHETIAQIESRNSNGDLHILPLDKKLLFQPNACICPIWTRALLSLCLTLQVKWAVSAVYLNRILFPALPQA